MKQLIRGLGLNLAAGVAALLQAEPVVIDDFNQYSASGYVQTQMWSLWRRFGEATTDGIYSIAKGAEGRGAHYAVNWQVGKAGFLRYSFPSAKSFPVGTIFSMDMSVTTSLPGTRVFLLLADGDPNSPSTTTYRTQEGQSLVAMDYETFGFEVTEASVRRMSGRATLKDVLGALASVTFIFTNNADLESQGIHFDNLGFTPPRTP